MGMFSRMTDIVQANINSMLDKAENPEKMIRLIIQEMEETLVELRSVAARQIAEQKRIQRTMDGLAKQSATWQQKAELAVSKGKDDLARAALAEKQAVDAKAAGLQTQYDELCDGLEKLQQDTGRLNAKLQEARSKQKAMAARQNSAAVRLKAKSVEHSDQIDQVMAKFDQYEQRIDDLEAQVDAYDLVPGSEHQSLQQQFAQLERDETIESALAELKAKQSKPKKAA